MQRSRRRNPYPQTWEVPSAVAVGFSLVLVVGVHLGRSVANVMAGNRWAFVERAELFTSLPGVLGGRAAAGLGGVASPASPPLLWFCIVLVEVGLLVASAGCLKVGLERWGPSRIHGTATEEEANARLGIARLRRHAPLIRPDIYGGWSPRHRSRPLPVRNIKTAAIGGDPS